jgi:hypothetical protein
LEYTGSSDLNFRDSQDNGDKPPQELLTQWMSLFGDTSATLALFMIPVFLSNVVIG